MNFERVNSVSPPKPEEILEEEAVSFDLYSKDFDVTIEKMTGKSVLDIGCGTDLDFLKYCLKHGINITGMDIQLPVDTNDELVKGHFVQGDIANIPFGNKTFDLILIRALSHDISLDEIKTILPALRSGGEIRIAPFFPETNPFHKQLIDKIAAAENELNCEVTNKQMYTQETRSGNFLRYSLTIKLK